MNELEMNQTKYLFPKFQSFSKKSKFEQFAVGKLNPTVLAGEKNRQFELFLCFELPNQKKNSLSSTRNLFKLFQLFRCESN